jgi:hypothetical protein
MNIRRAAVTGLKFGDSVFVLWEDSYGCSSRWTDLSDSGSPAPLLCRTLGFVGRKSSRYLVVIPHLAKDARIGVAQGCGDMAIPLAAIVKCQKIRIPG